MRLRDLEEKDVDGMLEWMHSDLAKRIFEKDFNKFTRDDVINFVKNANSSDTEFNYACVDNNDEYLGTVSLKNVDYKNKNAEFAISFREKAHGSGAATYATKAILKKAFEELDLENVYLDVLDINKRANAFYNKFGFIQVNNVEKDNIVKDGHSYKLLWYNMSKKEYEKKYGNNEFVGKEKSLKKILDS